MADLVTRLLLNTSQFDNNITSSTQKVRNFQHQGNAIKGTLQQMANGFGLNTSTLLKFGTVAGGAALALEGFKGVMNHSQLLTDEYNVKIEQAKKFTDSLFASIASGNITAFAIGFNKVAAAAREYAQAMDNLGTSTTLITPEIELHQTKYRALLAISQDVGESAEVRRKALKGAREELEKQITLQKALLGIELQASKSALASQFSAESGGRKMTDSFAQQALKVNTNTGEAFYQERLKAFKAEEQSIKNQMAIIERTSRGNRSLAQDNEYARLQGELKNLQNNQHYQNYKALDRIENTPEGQELIKAYKQGSVKLEVLNQTIAQSNKELSRSEKRINGTGTGTSNVDNDIFKNYSPVELSQNKQLFGTGGFASFDNELRQLQQKLDGKKLLLSIETDPNSRAALEQDVNKITGQMKSLTKENDKYSKSLKNTGKKDNTKQNEAEKDSLDNLILSAQNLGAAFSFMGEDASKGMQAISSAALMAQAMAAMVKTLKTCVTPWDYIAAIGAGVAATVAAFSQLPAFANGGIVQGTSAFGDMNLARVNSGEAILNTTQQRNLFNMLNSGSVGGAAGQVEFKISGTTLKGVLKNYDKKMGKI